MIIFIDTSAFIAVLNSHDLHHSRARQKWEELVSGENSLLCSNYILVETLALVQSRFGMDGLRIFQEDIVPILTIEWIDESAHKAAASSLLAANNRDLSLVDCVSFETMRRLGIKTVFTFDKHFREQGFKCLPSD